MFRWHFHRNFRSPSKAVKFISYPKTGSTWLRLLLGRYFQLLWSLDDVFLLEGTEHHVTIMLIHL